MEELAGPLEEELEVAAALGSGRARVSDAAAVVVVLEASAWDMEYF